MKRPAPSRPRRLAAAALLLVAAGGCGGTGSGEDAQARAVLSRPPADDFYRVAWLRIEAPARWRAGRTEDVLVTLRNPTRYVWPDPQLANPAFSGGGAVRLSYRWWQGDTLLAEYSRRTDLPWPLRPAATVTLPLGVDVPATPGEYRLQLDLVHELVSWFGSRGGTPLTLPVLVESGNS